LKIRMIEGIAGLAAILLVAASVAAPIYADSTGAAPAEATSAWLSLGGPAWMNYTGAVPVLTATYVNQSVSATNETDPSGMSATAYAVVHNFLGQTVAIETVPITGLSSGQNATVSFYFAVPLDVYTVNLFVLSSSGMAISADSNSTVVA